MRRSLLAALLVPIAAAAAAATINTTDATLFAKMTLARPGDTLRLRGNYGRVIIKNKTGLTIDAAGATMKSLEIYDSRGITIRGGLVDPADLNAWKAVAIRDSANVRLEGARVTRSGAGISVYQSSDVKLINNLLYGLRSDCIDLAGAPRAVVVGNTCRDNTPVKAIVDARGRVVKDGDHADGVQLWPLKGYPNVDIVIRNNTIHGDMQGIWSNGKDGDGTGSDRVTIEGNDIRNTFWWGIALDNTRGTVVRYNRVAAVPGTVRIPGGEVQSRIVIDGPNNVVCGNILADPRGSMPGADRPCRTAR